MKQDKYREKIHEWELEGIDETLFETALMHPSYDNSKKRSNQRLEFLGDAVLGLILAEHLFEKFPHCNEGEMTRMWANLPRNLRWLKWLRKLVWAAFFFGKRGRKDGGRTRPSTLADALEAVIASIYLSFGLEKATKFVFKIFRCP